MYIHAHIHDMCTWFGAGIVIPRLSVDGISVRNVRVSACFQCLLNHLVYISIPPLACMHLCTYIMDLIACMHIYKRSLQLIKDAHKETVVRSPT